jgi:hypothetical protein
MRLFRKSASPAAFASRARKAPRAFLRPLAGLPAFLTVLIAALALSAAPALAARENPVTQAATEITATTAILHGELNPGTAGEPGEWAFRVAEAPESCASGQGILHPFPPEPAQGHKGEAIAFEVTGRRPSTTYVYCAVAFNAGLTDETSGTPVAFTTLGIPPTVENEHASAVGPFSTRLEAVVNPNNQTTSCKFEYGPSTAYGTSVPCEPSGLTGHREIPVAVAAANLQQDKTYHFRLVAENAAHEKTEGADQELTTGTPEPPIIMGESVSGLTTSEPKLEATVNPNYQETTYVFEYSTQATGEQLEGTIETVAGAPPQPALPSIFEENGIQAQVGVTGLQPGSTFYRVAATNASGTTHGVVQEFAALATPSVATNPAVQVGSVSVVVSGSTIPQGTSTRVHFVYVDQAGYEAAIAKGESAYTLAKSTSAVEVGSGYEPESVGSVTLGELRPGTIYHYALVGENELGVAASADRTFTTTGTTPVEPGGEAEIPGLAPQASPFPGATLPAVIPFTSIAALEAREAKEDEPRAAGTNTSKCKAGYGRNKAGRCVRKPKRKAKPRRTHKK